MSYTSPGKSLDLIVDIL